MLVTPPVLSFIATDHSDGKLRDDTIGLRLCDNDEERTITERANRVITYSLPFCKPETTQGRESVERAPMDFLRSFTAASALD